MSDPKQRASDAWYSGDGDPFESPKYLKARAALDAGGLSADFEAKLRPEVEHYEAIHQPAGVDDRDVPDPPDQAAAGAPGEDDSAYEAALNEGRATVPVADTENRLAPDYYDDHPMTAMAEAPQAAPPSRSFWDRFFSGGGGDMAMAMAQPWQPATGDEPLFVGMRNPFGGGDEAAGAGAALQATVTGDEQPRTIGRGMSAPLDARSAYEVGRDTELDRQRMAQSEDPGLYALGRGYTEVLATLPGALIGGGGAAPTMARTFGTAGGMGAGYGATTGALESEPDAGMGELALDTGAGALTGGALGLATAGVGEGLARAPFRAAPAFGLAGAGYGAYEGYNDPDSSMLEGAAKYGAGAALLGPAAVGALSTLVPRSRIPGITRRGLMWRAGAPGGYGSDLSRIAREGGDDALVELGADIERLGLDKRPWWSPFKTPSGYYRDASALEQRLGSDIGETLADAGEQQGVFVPREQIVRGLRARARSLPADTDTQIAQRQKMLELARRVRTRYPEQMSPQQAHGLKGSYEDEAFVNEMAKNTPMGRAHRMAAGAPRGALNEAMETMAEQTETLPRYQAAMRDYGPAATVARMSNKRIAQEIGNQQVSLLEAAPGSLAAAAGVRLSRMGGKDMAANAARGLATMAQQAPSMPSSTGALAAMALPYDEPDEPPPPSPALDQSPSPPARRAPAEPKTPEQVAGEGRGNATPDAVRQLLGSDPSALGDWGAPIQQAIDDGDELRVNAEIAKAQQDPEFRHRYGAQLAAMTGGR